MAIIHVGYTPDGIVLVSIVEGENVKQVPMYPGDAHKIAGELLNAAALASGSGGRAGIILPEGIRHGDQSRDLARPENTDAEHPI